MLTANSLLTPDLISLRCAPQTRSSPLRMLRAIEYAKDHPDLDGCHRRQSDRYDRATRRSPRLTMRRAIPLSCDRRPCKPSSRRCRQTADQANAFIQQIQSGKVQAAIIVALAACTALACILHDVSATHPCDCGILKRESCQNRPKGRFLVSDFMLARFMAHVTHEELTR